MKPLKTNQRGASTSLSFRLDTDTTASVFEIVEDTPNRIWLSAVLRAFVLAGLDQLETGNLSAMHPEIQLLSKERDRYIKDRAEKAGAIPASEAEAMIQRIEELEKRLQQQTDQGAGSSVKPKTNTSRKRRSQ